MRLSFRLLACLFILPAIAAALWGQAPKNQPADSIDKDYSSELPRIKETEPDKALATFTVAKGFRMDLVAAEPLLADPPTALLVAGVWHECPFTSDAGELEEWRRRFARLFAAIPDDALLTVMDMHS